jgi:hypothetical protein
VSPAKALPVARIQRQRTIIAEFDPVIGVHNRRRVSIGAALTVLNVLTPPAGALLDRQRPCPVLWRAVVLVGFLG